MLFSKFRETLTPLFVGRTSKLGVSGDADVKPPGTRGSDSRRDRIGARVWHLRGDPP